MLTAATNLLGLNKTSETGDETAARARSASPPPAPSNLQTNQTPLSTLEPAPDGTTPTTACS